MALAINAQAILYPEFEIMNITSPTDANALSYTKLVLVLLLL